MYTIVYQIIFTPDCSSAIAIPTIEHSDTGEYASYFEACFYLHLYY